MKKNRSITMNKVTSHFKTILTLLMTCIILCTLLSGCTASGPSEVIKPKTLLVPHIEIGQMSGDDPGETQLAYEAYFADGEELQLKDGHTVYVSANKDMAMIMTSEGKVQATESLTVLLCDDRFDFSETTIIAMGCSGGNSETTTLGDTFIITGICDYDLGHDSDVGEDGVTPDGPLWYEDPSYTNVGCCHLNQEFCDKAYELVKDIPMESTELTKKIIKESQIKRTYVDREPEVLKGSSVTSDNYWKGERGHQKALQVVDHYKCRDPYMATEMEDIAIANVAKRFGLSDRLLVVRTCVNFDTFMGSDNAVTLWGKYYGLSDADELTNSEKIDIFTPAMRNLFKVVQRLNDAVLAGEL